MRQRARRSWGVAKAIGIGGISFKVRTVLVDRVLQANALEVKNMISAPLPANEEDRLRCLDELQILDTLEEAAYDDLTFLAAQICDTPIALVSLVDRERQWFKSHYGLDAHETPRNLAFCAHAILTDQTLVIEDSLRDKRFFDNPLVTGAPEVKFYAGAPLILRTNLEFGTLLVQVTH